MTSRLSTIMLALALCLAALAPHAARAQQGTWAATPAAPEALETALLLTDGTVVVHSWNDYTHWFKLTPDATGNYANGTWSQIASNAYGRLYGQTAVLRDGRVFYGGGEYLSGTSDHNTCEIYDPVANSWTAGPDSLYSALGDTGSAILPDGRLLCSNWSNDSTDIYDPATNSWSAAGTMSTSNGDEETWLSLADGSVLSAYHVGQRYIPSLNAWQATAALPNTLVDAAGELGPGLILYDGRAFIIGATPHTAFYTSPTTLTGAGSWAAGPDMPSGYGGPDTPGCVEVNGKVLCVGTLTDYKSGTNFLEFDPSTNAFTTVDPPAGYSSSTTSFVNRLLALPNGQVMMTGSYNNAWVYTPVSGPQASWRPVVSSVVANIDGSYTVAGTQLNGLTNGAAYGDEANPYTHYPIVYLVDSAGGVHFARTFNFSQMNPSAPGGQQSADFDLPIGLANGTYGLYVSASGVSSAAFSFTLGASAPPTISGFTPTSGPVGTVITLAGTHFNGVTSIRFYGANATAFSTNGAGTQITVAVPSGAFTGPIQVKTPGGTVKTSSNFTVAAPPAISGFTPSSGPAGTVVTLTGTNLKGVTSVRFYGANATTFSSNGAGTQLTVTVPAGAVTGPIQVKTPAGTVKTTTNFTVSQ